MKVAELEGPALDWAVAKAQGWVNFPTDSKEQGRYWYVDAATAPFCQRVAREYYTPSVDGREGVYLLDKYKIEIGYSDGWYANMYNRELDCYPAYQGDTYRAGGDGPTVLIAAMRCLVASVYGEDIDIPEELT
jgi:hypothetical protein